MQNEDHVLTFLILGFILDHIFGPKKDKLFCPVFVFHKMKMKMKTMLKNENHTIKVILPERFRVFLNIYFINLKNGGTVRKLKIV